MSLVARSCCLCLTRRHDGTKAGRRVMFSPVMLMSSSSSNNFGVNNDSNDNHHHRHLKVYHLQGETMTRSKSGVTVHTLNTDHSHMLATDLPKLAGGKNLAPQPVELLLAAWMGCTQATAVFVGRHMPQQRLLIQKLEFFNIQAVRDERGALELPLRQDNVPPAVPSRLTKITGTIRVYYQPRSSKAKNNINIDNAMMNVLTREELNLLRQQTEWRCPVANMMIASGCDLDGVEWVDGNAVKQQEQE